MAFKSEKKNEATSSSLTLNFFTSKFPHLQNIDGNT